MIGIMIGLAIVWALLISFLTLTAILASYKNSKDIEALESWKIISNIKIPDDDGKGGAANG